MSLFNIHDQRTSKETNVDAVFEVDCTDYENLGLPKTCKRHWTGWQTDISIYDASMRVGKIKGLVTLFLYDAGKIKEDFDQFSRIHPEIEEEPLDMVAAWRKNLTQVY